MVFVFSYFAFNILSGVNFCFHQAQKVPLSFVEVDRWPVLDGSTVKVAGHGALYFSSNNLM